MTGRNRFPPFLYVALACIAPVVLGLTSGCSKPPPPPPVPTVSFNTLEDARNQARSNAEYNAAAYRAENPRYDNTFKIVGHGDSTQSPECPQGDGWATLSIMKVAGKDVEKYTLKCSTVSGALGCYLDSDFIKKSFAQDEGRCQDVNKVPFPLPKIGK